MRFFLPPGEQSIIDEYAATLREKLICEKRVLYGLQGVYIAIRIWAHPWIGRRNWRRDEK